MDGLLSLYPRFAFPWALLLILIVPWSIWLGSKLRALSPGRKWVAIVLRAVILTLLVMALAGAELVKKRDKLAVFFLLDHSHSIPEATRDASAQWVRDLCEQHMTGKDEAGVIVFGAQPSIELSVGPTIKLDAIRSFVSGEQTDLAAAMRVAMAAFPQGYMRRLVIMSDGNETRGSALEEAKIAQSAGVDVAVIPLAVGGGAEVRVSEVSAPSRAKSDEPFQLRVVVHSDEDAEATLKIYQRLKAGKRLLITQKVALHRGDNVFMLKQELESAGFYEYEVTVESAADTVVANNEGRAFVVVQGEPTVLYVEVDPSHSTYLRPALEAEGLIVEQVDPATMPTSLATLQNYDALVLSNVSAIDLGADLLTNLEAAVKDLGLGLVMIGGPDSFGAGGYLDTPLEEALPVDMDLKQRKILPRGALVLILHTCEIRDGNVWAREIGLASLNVLSSRDLMGALGYMYGPNAGYTGDTWIYQLQPVGDKVGMRRMLTSASQRIGDMMTVHPTLKMAYDSLKGANASVKRIVIISDGDPGAPSPGLLKDIKDAGISVSTVCIAPHSLNDQQMLRAIATITGGQYYFVSDPRNLPQIFSKEAAVVKRGILVEEPFTPTPKHDSELLMGILGEGLPELRGYVATTPKANATVPLVSHEDDPVLAHWRYGLGKSVAFTSDVTSRWAPEWLAWDGFNRFWAQTVRWAMRETSDSTFRVDVKAKGGKGHVKIDAVDDDGKFVNFLKPKAYVTGPGPEFKRYEVELTQSGPGIYEAFFPLDDRGSYMVNVTYVGADGDEGMVPTGLALGYSREYEHNATNLPLLENVAAAAGGSMISETDNPFTHDLKASATITPVWQYLALIAACLFPVEIFVRRLALNYSALWAPILALLRRVPALGSRISEPKIKAAPATGFYGAAQERDPETTPAAEDASFGVAAQAPPVAKAKKPKRDADAAEYTGALLAAKKRAQESTKRRSEAGEDKEDE